MAPNAQRILTVLERALTAQDPTASLRALTELRSEIDALERVHVSRALQAGATFADVARPLGISRQAAHRRYRDLATAPPPPPRSPVLSPEARAALIRAREEATRHGSGSIDSEHLLVAIARTARRPPRGLDVELARRNFGPPTVNAATPSGFRPSLHALLSRDNGPLKLDHLLRAALEDPDGGARRLLDRLGVAPESLREAL
ncbi:MAG TPA: Clp protease N-terminal domain-containing protein [Solirubrobacter sp.]|nr:Clp protease N-terminal domain-containing protein [Solirubrobacter sp.]